MNIQLGVQQPNLLETRPFGILVFGTQGKTGLEEQHNTNGVIYSHSFFTFQSKQGATLSHDLNDIYTP